MNAFLYDLMFFITCLNPANVMQYGNAGSTYITTRGVDLFLDADTEHRLEDA